MNEWEFTADFASWINHTLTNIPELPFSQAKCEQSGRGSAKRRDLTLLDKSSRAVLTGEIKLPYRRDGASPFNPNVVEDARAKARGAKSEYFFTWNINTFVLWETAASSGTWQERNYRSWEVTDVRKETDLELPMTMHAIKNWLPLFLHAFAAVTRRDAGVGTKSPDEKFIEILESSLHWPILLTMEELRIRYGQARFKSQLDKWMREEQGWIIRDDPEGIKDNLESAAKFACYALVNRLVFHEALLKRFGTKMGKLHIPMHVETGEILRGHLHKYFGEAIKLTGDYETVFGEDPTSIGNSVPYYSDAAVPHWRDLINRVHEFDFSKLDYEIIGNIFERLIAPERRHKYGQFYTRVEVVDLINSFCIRTGEEKIMDPACGGGTFLVRAYARKKELQPAQGHVDRLKDLFGVDIAHFATHLTTINLATRDLIDDENYPQITRSDFFDVGADKTFISLPAKAKIKRLDGKRHVAVSVPLLDAVIGNPPYIRQEQIPRSKKGGKDGYQQGTKEFYADVVKRESGASLSGRSDIHCYFWPHAAQFLKEGGYLCLLTSSQWLDVEYGFRLQDWILKNFEVVAIFESLDEPWFVGARVATVVTILRKERYDQKRVDNVIRFVQLRRPIAELLEHGGLTADAIRAADSFRDEILKATENRADRLYRLRLVRQGDLWNEGVRLGQTIKKSTAGDGDKGTAPVSNYYGYKWGMFLRAPDLWFRFLEQFKPHLIPASEVAEIRLGLISGNDEYFFPIDNSSDCLSAEEDPREFRNKFGINRTEVMSGKIKLVLCGKGRSDRMPIESVYLEPEVHSLMEVKGFSVGPGDCARMVLLVSGRKSELRGTHVLEYIKWGESKKIHEGVACASRVTVDRAWYDLTGQQRGNLFWPMGQQYKHAVPVNDHGLVCNHNLFMISPRGLTTSVLGGLLNSTWMILTKFQFGRPVGVEGNLKTETIDVKMMPIPNPTGAPKKVLSRIADAFEEMKKRKALQFLSEQRLRRMAYTQAGKEKELEKLSGISELEMPDRRELDDAVLELLGVTSKRERQKLIDELYAYLREFFESVRQKEEKAIVNKKTTARRSRTHPGEIAAQVYQEILDSHPSILKDYDRDFLDKSKPFDTYEIPTEGKPELYSDIFHPNGTRFTKGKNKEVKLLKTRGRYQDDLLILVAGAGERGWVRIPYEEQECNRVYRMYERFVQNRDELLRRLVAERTVDEDIQEKIYAALLPMVIAGSQ